MESHLTIDMPEDLIDEIQLEITEAPYDSIIHFLRRAVIDFCEESHYWQEEIGPVLVVDARMEYDLPVSRSFSATTIMDVSVLLNGNRESTTLQRCQTNDVKYRFWQETPFTIEFFPHEELVGKGISVIAALKPELYGNKFKFSENIIRDFRAAIVARAKSLLYKIPGKPWSDLNQAQINDGIFTSLSSEALLRQARGYSKLPDRAVRKARSFY